MPGLRLAIRTQCPKTELEKYIKAVNAYMEQQQLEAVKRWVKAVVRKTPTYTGTSRGTLWRLGNRVAYNVTKGAILGNAQNAKNKKYFTYQGNKVRLGFREGAQHSNFEIKRTRSGSNFFYHFSFEIDDQLLYPDWNDERAAPKWLNLKTKTPWEAYAAGEKAYDNYSKIIVKSFPDYKKYEGTRELRSK